MLVGVEGVDLQGLLSFPFRGVLDVEVVERPEQAAEFPYESSFELLDVARIPRRRDAHPGRGLVTEHLLEPLDVQGGGVELAVDRLRLQREDDAAVLPPRHANAGPTKRADTPLAQRPRLLADAMGPAAQHGRLFDLRRPGRVAERRIEPGQRVHRRIELAEKAA